MGADIREHSRPELPNSKEQSTRQPDENPGQTAVLSPPPEGIYQAGGTGGGGGGMGMARPVAAIEVGPRGVSVRPILDFTKIAIAALAALSSMALFWARVARNISRQR